MQSFRWGLFAALSAVFLSVSLGIISDVRIPFIILRAFIFGALFFGLGFGLRFVINSFFPELLYNEDESITQGSEQTGPRIDITIDTAGEYAVPELFKTVGDSRELGNIEDLISGAFRPRGRDDDQKANLMNDRGIDAGKEAGYNDVRGIEDFEDTSVFEIPASFEQPAAVQMPFTPSFGDDSGLGGLPDLDMMARAFSSVSGGHVSPMMGDSSAPSLPSLEMEPMEPMPSMTTMASIPSMSQPEVFEPEPVRYAAGNKPQTLDGDFNPKSLAEGIRTVLSKDN
ncbi:MAG: hypothetical protein FWD14_05135 [Treponema sp.]|nr:hypothetical protein [Treponema sp.]